MRWILCGLALLVGGAARAQPDSAVRVTQGRITIVSSPADAGLARNLLALATANDTFPGLPRAARRAEIAIAPDERRFHELVGRGAPEWGIAVAIPSEDRIVMQGRWGNSSAGDPRVTLRHELAHLALHEFAGSGLPIWFDEGYASFSAGEFGREQVLESSVALALRGTPHLATLDSMIVGGASRAEQGYALAHRAVADLAAHDPARGLTLFFQYWREDRTVDVALRHAYGITLSGFEDEWRTATRRRYGALALVGDLGFASLVLFVIIAPFWIARRRRDKGRLAAMVAADELLDRRDRESALATLLGDGEQMGSSDDQIKRR